jgi:hypothetical protein
LKHAEELTLKSGEAAVIYYRPIDEHWFVLNANAQAPRGLTIKATVQPHGNEAGRRDIPEHPLDGPARTDVHI